MDLRVQAHSAALVAAWQPEGRTHLFYLLDCQTKTFRYSLACALAVPHGPKDGTIVFVQNANAQSEPRFNVLWAASCHNKSYRGSKRNG